MAWSLLTILCIVAAGAPPQVASADGAAEAELSLFCKRVVTAALPQVPAAERAADRALPVLRAPALCGLRAATLLLSFALGSLSQVGALASSHSDVELVHPRTHGR